MIARLASMFQSVPIHRPTANGLRVQERQRADDRLRRVELLELEYGLQVRRDGFARESNRDLA